MDAIQWSTAVHATALALAQCLTPQELTRTALFFTQLGATMGTLAALQALDAADAEQATADLAATIL